MAVTPSIFSDINGGTDWQGTDTEDILWSQLPTGIALSSQKFVDYDSLVLDSGVANDFEFTVPTTINKIRWWGAYWNGSGPFPVDCYCQIHLYLDDGTGHAPTLPEHSTAIQYWAIPPGEYTEITDSNGYRIEYELPEWLVFDANTKYWIEFRKVFSLSGAGQWGWVSSEPILLSACVQGTTGITGGPEWWTARTTDAAFELIFDDALVLESSTWGDIKTIF